MVRRGIGAAAVLALPGAALAYGAGEIRSEFVANRTINVATQIDHSWTPTNDGTGVKVGRNFVMKAPGGRTVAAEATSFLTKGMALRLAARAVPLLGAGALAWDIYDAVRVKADGEGLKFDEGLDRVTQNVRCWRGYTGTPQRGGSQYPSQASCMLDYVAAGQADLEAWLPNDSGSTQYRWTGSYACSQSTASAASCGRMAQQRTFNTPAGTWNAWANWNYQSVSLTGNLSNQLICPAVTIDGVFWSAGSKQPGFDGKCDAGDYGPVTPEVAADMLAGYSGAPAVDLAALTAEALGVVPMPVTDPTSVEVGNVVPSSVEGPVTDEVFLDEFGQVRNTTTAVGWDWSRDPLRKNEGTWPKTTTTTVRDSAGNVISEKTTSELGLSPEEQRARESAEAGGDPCKMNPDSSACAALGAVPGEAELPAETRDLEITPVAGFGPSTATCPAPRTLNLALAGTVAMPFDLLCDYASGLRPLVIGFAWLSAVVAWLGLGRRGQG